MFPYESADMCMHMLVQWMTQWKCYFDIHDRNDKLCNKYMDMARPSYLHNRIFCTGEMTYLYWIRALSPFQYPIRRPIARSRTSIAVLPMCLSNFKATRWFKLPITRLRVFMRSYDKMSYCPVYGAFDLGLAVSVPLPIVTGIFVLLWFQSRLT